MEMAVLLISVLLALVVFQPKAILQITNSENQGQRGASGGFLLVLILMTAFVVILLLVNNSEI